MAASLNGVGLARALGRQVTFFLGVLALQLAITAGASGAMRAAAVWHAAAASGQQRAFVRRCTVVSLSALLGGVVAISTNFALAALAGSDPDRATLGAGAAVMLLAAGLGLVAAVRLDVNAADDDGAIVAAEPRGLRAVGERAITLVHQHPVVGCGLVTIAAAGWAMARAETTVLASLSWGAAEAGAVVAAFVLLGPTLGLRATGACSEPFT